MTEAAEWVEVPGEGVKRLDRHVLEPGARGTGEGQAQLALSHLVLDGDSPYEVPDTFPGAHSAASRAPALPGLDRRLTSGTGAGPGGSLWLSR